MGHRAQVVDALAYAKAPDSGDERTRRQLLLGHVVSQLAGHASVETMKLYDRREEQAKMRVVEWLRLGEDARERPAPRLSNRGAGLLSRRGDHRHAATRDPKTRDVPNSL